MSILFSNISSRLKDVPPGYWRLFPVVSVDESGFVKNLEDNACATVFQLKAKPLAYAKLYNRLRAVFTALASRDYGLKLSGKFYNIGTSTGSELYLGISVAGSSGAKLNLRKLKPNNVNAIEALKKIIKTIAFSDKPIEGLEINHLNSRESVLKVMSLYWLGQAAPSSETVGGIKSSFAQKINFNSYRDYWIDGSYLKQVFFAAPSFESLSSFKYWRKLNSKMLDARLAPWDTYVFVLEVFKKTDKNKEMIVKSAAYFIKAFHIKTARGFLGSYKESETLNQLKRSFRKKIKTTSREEDWRVCDSAWSDALLLISPGGGIMSSKKIPGVFIVSQSKPCTDKKPSSTPMNKESPSL
jgi:hypothetical protein